MKDFLLMRRFIRIPLSRGQRGFFRRIAILGALCLWCAAPAILPGAPVEGRREALALLAEGQEAQRAGRVSDAITLFQRSIELAPSPAAYYNLGMAYRKAGKRDEAREAFRKALELNPSYELARQALAELGGNGKESNAAAVGGMNVDSVENERETLESLKKVEGPVSSAKKPTILSIGALLPSPPKTSYAAKATVPKAPQQLAGEGAVKDAVIPSQPVEIINEVPTREIVTAGVERGSERGKIAATASEADSKSKIRPFSLWRDKKTVTSPEQESRTTKGGSSRHEESSTSAETKTKREKPEPSAEEINRVALGQQEESSKPPTRYGNPSKILLGSSSFHKEKGDSYRKAQRWVEAADEYQKVLEKNPDDVETRAMLAECLARAGETDIAENEFQKALSMDPNDPRVLFRMGNTYRELKQFDQAISAYKRALQADPNNKLVRNNLAVVYMEKGEYAKAAKEFKRLLEIDPAYDKALLNLGILYDEHLGDKQEALKYYRQYVEKNGPRAGEVRRWISELEGKK